MNIPGPRDFLDDDGNLADFLKRPELTALLAALLLKWGEKFGHLADADIVVLWKLNGGATGGKATYGKCQKASGLLKHFAACDFIIWLAADHCAASDMTSSQIEALLFHELLHAGAEYTEQGKKWVIWPHDLEMFQAEVQAYGLWHDGLKRLRQLDLFSDGLPTQASGASDELPPGVVQAAQRFKRSMDRLVSEGGLESVTLSTTIDGETKTAFLVGKADA